MQNKGIVIVLTVVITALCLYYLSFTFVSRKVQQDAITHATDEKGTVNLARKQAYLDSLWNKPVYDLGFKEYTYKEVKENELALGLDLQGGMHVVLEISPADIVRGLGGSYATDETFSAALAKAREGEKRGEGKFTELFRQAVKAAKPDERLSLYFASAANKDRISQSATDNEVVEFLDREIDEAIERSFTILKTRIDQFGTSQPNIQRLQGTGRIQIEIPGADNPQRVRKLLQGVARLEFWDVAEYNDPTLIGALSSVNDKLTQELRAQQTTAPATTNSAALGDTTQSDLAKQLAAQDSTGNSLDSLTRATTSPLFGKWSQGVPFLYDVKDTAEINRVLRRPDVRNLIPSSINWAWDVKPDPEVTPGVEDIQLNFLSVGRNRKPLLTGEVITDARNDFDEKGAPAVTMNMNASGTKTWAKITREASQRQPKGRIAIVLDNFVYTAPTVQGEIPNGNSQITGNFALEEAKDLANVLKAGSLPAPTRIVEEAIVGPTLGKVAQNQGLISMACGLGLVVIFMIGYYSKGGWIANLALLFNIFFILGILAQLDSALTLPGIAGIVLTMGMAVDANVLIYERIKEEMRHGRKLLDAIKKGYQRAFATIFDSNLTTLLTAIALFVYGQGPLRGFAIVLMIGIGTSFFSAVYISRVFVEWITRKGDESKISFETGLSGMVGKRKEFDFIGTRKIAYLGSIAFIVLGGVLIAIQGLNLGVDFKGGRSYVVTFKEAVEATEMKVALAEGFENAGTEVKNFGSNNAVKVTTAYLIDDDSDAADEKVKKALIDGVAKKTGFTYLENAGEVADKTFTIGSSSKVSATVADDIKNSAWKASILSLIAIFIYILVRFKKWQYSAGAIIATIHDALFVFAAFAVARVFGIAFEVDQVFVAAVLTVIGYSINDTVIIFDRIREYFEMGTSHDRKRIFNDAINSTLSRTLITSGTTLIVVVVLFLFGGESLRGFSFALLVGIGVGTFSSIFIASPVVYDFDPKDEVAPAVQPKAA
ncbi:MAG: protein translocase subunit SecDF [Cyclobacteriaceae bacterium]|jgi:SecD/SecF fusion protein